MFTPRNKRLPATPHAAKSANSADQANDGSDGGYNAGIAVFSYIVGGIIVWSLIGWGLDNLWGTRWIVLLGALLGATGGFYLSHMHGLTSHRSSSGGSKADSGPSQDGDSNAK
ncbi:AtpZ/AtpI family protein [Arthrobacter bambusae]|uniref:AtpZ/AtpI family protein n=1 Tax=Arthrobacter bambusae TaxID=1338426 RepID=UPI002783322E|nr:AtpZ/AtpI family protein [Arthrobacter bambusae]MDQ0031847.1 F0F1-type ATP synthase assembly protein I [Arthrobacter bambusae]MDQ0099986.1 F0F1-type ATP synthase assembly protein I [Arthrobacter bambusae]